MARQWVPSRYIRIQPSAAVFLAGGIGITPFISIVRQADHDRLPHKLYLFYSNRRPEDTAFLEALQTLEKSNPNFQLVCTMTAMPQSQKEWKGETGLIRQRDVVETSDHAAGTHLLQLPGLPPWLLGMRKMLVGAGVDEDDVRTEEFAGY